jgi:hypothetical protein
MFKTRLQTHAQNDKDKEIKTCSYYNDDTISLPRILLLASFYISSEYTVLCR